NRRRSDEHGSRALRAGSTAGNINDTAGRAHGNHNGGVG
ncbi:hypothetical protein A2U01_0097248, partial [Trifolium medium]|nr:hypothetical protein [Trifolium medium]